jgi:tRNA-binding protein
MEGSLIEWNDFEKIEIRVGTVIEVRDFPEAKNPSYKLLIDFGVEIGLKKSSAQITLLYSKENLIGKQIVAVMNFPKKQIGKFMSECLVLGCVGNSKEVILLVPDNPVKNGLKIA